MRQLTDQEKELTRKGIERMDTELRWMQFEKKYTELMLEEGLLINFQKQEAQFRNNLARTKEGIESHRETIKAMEDQIVNGVEEKKPAKEDAAEVVYEADIPPEGQ